MDNVSAYHSPEIGPVPFDPVPFDRPQTQSDLAGRTVSTIQNYDSSELGSNGLPTQDDTAQDVMTAYQYDSAGRLATMTVYDAQGPGTTLQSQATEYLYGSTVDASLVTAVVDPGSTDTVSQDSSGDWSITTDTGDHTSTTYDWMGRTATTTDANGNTTTYTYDNLGRQIVVTEPISSATPSTTTIYTPLGDVASTSDALGDTTTYGYDDFDREISVTDPDGKETQYAYNPDGTLLSETDPDNNTTTYAYDALGRVTSVTDSTASPETVTTYTYNGDDLVQTVDPDGNTTDYAYDQFDRESGETWYASGQTSPYETLAFTYDADGELKTASDTTAAGTTTDSYWYDGLGRATRETEQIAGLTSAITLTSTYDTVGNRTQLSATIGTTPDFVNNYQYDAAGNMTEVAQSGQSGGNTVASISAAFSYDNDGNVTAMSYFNDASTSHTPTDTSDLVAAAVYRYDADGRLTDLTYSLPSGSTGTAPAYEWTYDAANRITEQYSRADTNPSDANYNPDPSQYATWAEAQYNYDADGQLTTTTTDTIRTYAVTYSSNWQNAPSVGGVAGTESYNYDANGNETGNGVTVSSPTSATGNNQISGDGNYNYTYDANGSLVSQVQCSGNTNTQEPYEIDYQYDNRNRLTLVSDLDSGGNITQTVSYTYDASNRLVGRTVTQYAGGNPDTADAQVQRYVYDGTNMVLQFDGTNSNNSLTADDLSHRYLWGPAVDQILADEQLYAATGGGFNQTTPGNVVWALTDNQGTVRDLAQYDPSTQTTSIVDHVVYTAFGNTSAPPTNFDFGYTGCYYDADTGLQWNQNRWYNPSIQRWMSQDPSGLGPDSNPYRYCGNGPTDGTDPSGEVIVSHCNLDKYLKKYISISNGLAEQKGQDGNYWYSNLDGSVSRFNDSKESLILYQMIASPYEYWVAGSNEDDCRENIGKQVDTRVRIVELTEQRKNYDFKEVNNPPLNWSKYKDNPLAYFRSINKEGTTMGCTLATMLTFHAGVQLAGGAATRKLSGPDDDCDFVPGDWGYICNVEGQVNGWSMSLVGENIICVGLDQYWGHISSENTVKSMRQWFDYIKTWWAQPIWYNHIWGCAQYGTPALRRTVQFPTAGLDVNATIRANPGTT
jgi:RHS repeat-associated protein